MLTIVNWRVDEESTVLDMEDREKWCLRFWKNPRYIAKGQCSNVSKDSRDNLLNGK
jgi:hypothetical protein